MVFVARGQKHSWLYFTKAGAGKGGAFKPIHPQTQPHNSALMTTRKVTAKLHHKMWKHVKQVSQVILSVLHSKIAKNCCDSLLLSHSANFIKLTLQSSVIKYF